VTRECASRARSHWRANEELLDLRRLDETREEALSHTPRPHHQNHHTHHHNNSPLTPTDLARLATLDRRLRHVATSSGSSQRMWERHARARWPLLSGATADRYSSSSTSSWCLLYRERSTAMRLAPASAARLGSDVDRCLLLLRRATGGGGGGAAAKGAPAAAVVASSLTPVECASRAMTCLASLGKAREALVVEAARRGSKKRIPCAGEFAAVEAALAAWLRERPRDAVALARDAVADAGEDGAASSQEGGLRVVLEWFPRLAAAAARAAVAGSGDSSGKQQQQLDPLCPSVEHRLRSELARMAPRPPLAQRVGV